MSTWRLIRDLIRNPPLEGVDPDTGVVVDRFQVDRRDRWEIVKPAWIHTACTRRLPCGCRRRWWGTMAIYLVDCEQHWCSHDRP